MVTHLVVAAALHREGRLLLCHRSPTRRWYPDVWDFPGGHVEGTEAPLDALARELDEELGITAPVLRPDPLLTKVDGELDLTVWVCTSWKGVIGNRQPDEHDDVRWFTRKALPGLTLADPDYLAPLTRLLS